jgi:hypothetical protein
MSGWRKPIASDMMKSPAAYDRSGPNRSAGALAWVAICRVANAPHGEEVSSINCGANQMTAARTPTFEREADVSCIAPLSNEGMVLCIVSTFLALSDGTRPFWPPAQVSRGFWLRGEVEYPTESLKSG